MKDFFMSILRWLGLANKPNPVELTVNGTELIEEAGYDALGSELPDAKADDFLSTEKEVADQAAPPEVLSIIVDATPSPDPQPTVAELEQPPKRAPKHYTDAEGNPAILAYFKEVPELRTENSFALDLHFEGVEAWGTEPWDKTGFSSFQITDIKVAPGIDLVAYDKGSILRGTGDVLGGHITQGPMASGGRIDFGNKHSYYARFGGYASQRHAVKRDGTLYRFYFNGNHAKGTVELIDFYFGRGGRKLPMVDPIVKY